MKGLLLKLSALDADAETAVRVIAFFDALVERGATVVEVLRSAAALADCVTGLELDGGPPLRYAPGGGSVAGKPGEPSGQAAVGEHGRVWLERAGEPLPLDDLVLERCAITVRLLEAPRHTPAPHLADPALVELVLSEREAAEDRSRAVKLLGLVPDRPVRIVAVATVPGKDPGAEAVALIARTGRHQPVRMALVGPHAALILQPPKPGDALLPTLEAALTERATVRLGFGGPADTLDARTSWEQAQLALRFTSAETPVVDFTKLGSLALLAKVPVDLLRRDTDVQALTALASTPNGKLDVAALEAFCHNGSLRKAADLLHLHHSSVASRIARIEDTLGWALDTPEGRFRAMLALLARRLADT
ncbi:PucR family transcriptional regulator [Amycolatopsis sp. H20-H5]|uniref:PucR family transcriptional regulator n=1 Tax=Amycolatopsis sp. H20-H5 TaxID=3046309 RepID=UPI002DB5EFD8|nr:helix-turn-helix domain-containing protein [Amycolatopsis sp. H20-H5]MEC3982260.1 helix-turn-helix domain-containing protein [Amycolatopsis sp. H20-H5]